MLKEILFYWFMPKVYVLSFETGSHYVGRLLRHLPDKTLIFRLIPPRVIEINLNTPLIPDSEGYYILGDCDGDSVTPYFDVQEFEDLKQKCNTILLVRKVSEKQREAVRRQMSQLRTALEETVSLLDEQVTKTIAAINSSFVDSITLIRSSLEQGRQAREAEKKAEEQAQRAEGAIMEAGESEP